MPQALGCAFQRDQSTITDAPKACVLKLTPSASAALIGWLSSYSMLPDNLHDDGHGSAGYDLSITAIGPKV
jgi:hypothetical protein